MFSTKFISLGTPFMKRTLHNPRKRCQRAAKFKLWALDHALAVGVEASDVPVGAVVYQVPRIAK